jgi:hyperosmotically inducible periplasmic protein
MVEATAKRTRLIMIALLVAGTATPLAACATINGQESAPQYVSDASLTAKVKANIVEDQSLKGFEIGVETMNHVVQLSGFVDTRQQKNQATTIAQSVPGVESVQNNILVRAQNAPG